MDAMDEWGDGAGGRFDQMVVEDAPDDVIDQIVERFRTRTPHTAQPGFAARVAARIRASLAFDDWSAGPALAVRGIVAPAAGPRHLVYAFDAPGGAAQVALSLYPVEGGRVTIVGQLLSDTDEAYLVEVIADATVVAAATCSGHGEFAVDAPAAWDEIVLVGPDADVIVAHEGGDVARP
jgi:hypothetical protein